MDTSDGFKALQDRIQKALIATTRSVNSLASEDLAFQRTASSEVAQELDQKSARLLDLSNRLLSSAGNASGLRVPTLEEADDVDTYYKSIVDVIDSLLERADTCLDEFTGIVKRKDAPTGEQGPSAKKTRLTGRELDRSIRNANITKPQKSFEHKPDNDDPGPWRPLLTVKPHAILPLEQSLATDADDTGFTQFKHPYETEILRLQYPDAVYQSSQPIKYLPVETTAAVWVDTYEGVLAMLEELKGAREIAVDLEHHDFRSYNGLLSLMQISTREKDWIVDTLKPWRRRLEVLNEVFADPKIVKVFHGAYMDIVWLQRDLGLYVVGLFDTFHASDALNYPTKSLAYLLKRFADFDADKKYQLADWRIRPLPEEMFYYARSDTHFLLYIYDMIKNDLIEHSDKSDPTKNLVDWVLQKSKEVSLQRYSITPYDTESGQGPRGWYNVLVKTPGALSGEQFAVYRALHKWRDDVARRTDDSPIFIMPQYVVASIAKQMPEDAASLQRHLAKANLPPGGAAELLALIQRARADGSGGPSLMEFLRLDTNAQSLRTTQNRSATALAPRVDQPLPSADELRSERSQFWGPVAVSSVWDGGDETAGRRPSGSQEVALPWTLFVEGAAIAQAEAASAEQQPATGSTIQPGAQHAPPEANGQVLVDDREFTLRAGRKRKTSEMEDSAPGEASDSDSDSQNGVALPQAAVEKEMVIRMDIDDDDDDGDDEDGGNTAKKAAKELKRQQKIQKRLERKAAARAAAAAARTEEPADPEADKQLTKAEKRQARRAAKAAKKAAAREQKDQLPAAATAATGAAALETDEAPFDYSQAASMLQGKGKQAERGNGAQVFDPYAAKTQASMQGARKHNYEKPGKTATFKG